MRGLSFSQKSSPCQRAFFRVSALASLAMLTGCASIVTQLDHTHTLNSNPSGANVTVANRSGEIVYSGITPTTVKLPDAHGPYKSAQYTFTFEKEGYSPTVLQSNARLEEWYIIGNFFSWDLIGWFIVDPLTGAMWAMDDDMMTATLQPRYQMTPMQRNAPPPQPRQQRMAPPDDDEPQPI